jgi:steroid 5-alpha reductase family enzyme
MTAVATSVVLPLTIYRQAYSFSVAYALVAAALGGTLLKSFDVSPVGPAMSLAGAMIFYGIRLGAFLLLRQVTVPSKNEIIKEFEKKTPRLKRIPFSLAIGLFYGFMNTPALYLFRTDGLLSETGDLIAKIGATMAWLGATIEAWTDGQKFLAKRGKDGSLDFLGPSKGWYGVSRHPNYFAEILFWIGLFVAGLPGFFVNLSLGNGIALVCSLLGFAGIIQTMLGATERLETKQDTNYGGQMSFEAWKSNTNKLVPTNILGLALPLSISVVLANFARKATLSLLGA